MGEPHRGGLTSVKSHKRIMGSEDPRPLKSKQDSERDTDQPDSEPNDSNPNPVRLGEPNFHHHNQVPMT